MLNQIQHLILKTLNNQESCTARTLSESLQVDESTVSRNLRQLLQMKVVSVEGYLPASNLGGRQTRLLSINSRFATILGVSIEQGELCLLLSDFSANPQSCKQETVKIDSRNFADVLSKVISDYADRIDAFAIATPGLVDSSQRRIIYSQALGIENLCLDDFVRRFGLPYVVMNDANAAAASYSSEAKDLIYFLLSIPFELSKPVGLGAGIVLNGNVYEGSNNCAGELGEGVPLCEGSTQTLKDFLDEKDSHKELPCSERFLEHISSKIATAVNLIDPQLIVLGGDFCMFKEQLLREIVEKVKNAVTARKIKDLDWRFDAQGSRTIALGAIQGFLSRFFQDIDFANHVISKKGCDVNARL